MFVVVRVSCTLLCISWLPHCCNSSLLPNVTYIKYSNMLSWGVKQYANCYLFRSFVIFNVLDLYHSWEAKLEVAPVVSIVWNSSRLPVPETLLDSFSREYTSLKMSKLFARLARYNLTRSFPQLIIFQYTKFRRKKNRHHFNRLTTI